MHSTSEPSRGPSVQVMNAQFAAIASVYAGVVRRERVVGQILKASVREVREYLHCGKLPWLEWPNMMPCHRFRCGGNRQ